MTENSVKDSGRTLSEVWRIGSSKHTSGFRILKNLADLFSRLLLLVAATRTDLQIKIPFSIGVVDDARADRIASQGAESQRSIERLRSQNLPVFL
jgi:hypothetical protein